MFHSKRGKGLQAPLSLDLRQRLKMWGQIVVRTTTSLMMDDYGCCLKALNQIKHDKLFLTLVSEVSGTNECHPAGGATSTNMCYSLYSAAFI